MPNIIPQNFVDSFLTKKIEMVQEISDALKIEPTDAAYICEQIFCTTELFLGEQEQNHVMIHLEKLWTDKSAFLKSYTDPQLLITAGSPGAGKTTQLNEILSRYKKADVNFFYTDPDEEVLMTLPQYLLLRDRAEALVNGNDKKIQDLVGEYGAKNFGRMVAYTYYRWGSNYIQSELINRAADAQYNIAIGTTLTGGAVKDMFEKNDLENGVVGFIPRHYSIDIMVFDAPMEDKERWNHERHTQGSGKFVPAKDLFGKADLLKLNFPRFPEWAAKSGGSVLYFWRDAQDPQPRAVADFSAGHLRVHDQATFENMAGRYGTNVEELRKTFRDNAIEPNESKLNPGTFGLSKG